MKYIIIFGALNSPHDRFFKRKPKHVTILNTAVNDGLHPNI